MISPEERKQDIIFNIEQNPTNISLDVKTKEVVNGAWKITKSTKLLKVRIFEQKKSETTIISDTKGTADVSKRYGMLADFNAGLMDISTNLKFSTLYGEMEITAVYPQIAKGVVCGYQCDLKRVI